MSEPVTPQNEGAKSRLIKTIQTLDDPTCAVLETIVAGLGVRCEEDIEPDSDIVTEPFARNFRTRLQLHHATHEEVFKKKSFEFAFKAASVVAGRLAEMEPNVTSAGFDVRVDGVRFSLKTEAGKQTSKKLIKISKLMEARWIRRCKTSTDFFNHMEKLTQHFSHYDRVLTLRVFRVIKPFPGVRYELWEIPHKILGLVSTIKPEDFTDRTENGTSTVIVKQSGEPVFKLRMDGSVEKITLEQLSVSLCKKHGSWTVESLVMESEDD